MPEFVWLIILALCLVVEIATLGLVTIWFAGGALVTFFVAMVTDNLLIQVIVFLVVSLLLLFFTRCITAFTMLIAWSLTLSITETLIWF